MIPEGNPRSHVRNCVACLQCARTAGAPSTALHRGANATSWRGRWQRCARAGAVPPLCAGARATPPAGPAKGARWPGNARRHMCTGAGARATAFFAFAPTHPCVLAPARWRARGGDHERGQRSTLNAGVGGHARESGIKRGALFAFWGGHAGSRAPTASRIAPHTEPDAAAKCLPPQCTKRWCLVRGAGGRRGRAGVPCVCGPRLGCS